jgi:hypothetical protein
VSDFVDNMSPIKTPEALMRDSIERLTLERAAQRIERLDGNSTYRQAYRLAARAIRAMKRD